MKTSVALALLGFTKALENVEGDSKSEVAVWQDTNALRWFSPQDKQCTDSTQCEGPGYVCAGHMWEYNNQQESAKGCWHGSVCKDRSFYMFDGRMIQFFCDEAEIAGQDFGMLEYPIWPAGEDHWDEWETTCESHQDCKDMNGKMNQHCTDFTWEAREDGWSWGTGTACYSWDYNRCNEEKPDQSFAIENINYGTTKFSYFTQLWCRGQDWNFDFSAGDDARMPAAEGPGDWEEGDWDEKERRDSDDDRRRGSGSDRTTSRLVMEQYDDGTMRLEMVMGATKLAAAAATAAVATTLF